MPSEVVPGWAPGQLGSNPIPTTACGPTLTKALRYATSKQDLATEYAHERDRYVDAKPPFANAMIERAWQWRPLA